MSEPNAGRCPAVRGKAGVDLAQKVIVLDRANAAHQRDAVHDPGLQRHVLADLAAGQRRGDRRERPAKLGRGVRLQIVHVDVARPAAEHDIDQRLRPLRGSLPPRIARGAGRPASPADARMPQSQELATSSAGRSRRKGHCRRWSGCVRHFGVSRHEHAPPSRSKFYSRQNAAHDLAADVGQAAVDAVVVERQPLVVDAEQVQHRGVEVVPVDAGSRPPSSRPRRSRRRRGRASARRRPARR